VDHAQQALPVREALPVSGVVDDSDTPGDVVDLLLLEAFSTGRQPFARTRELENVLPAASLLPAGARLIRDARDDHAHNLLAVGDDWTIRAVHWKRNRRATVTVTAASAEQAEAQLALAIEGAVDPADTGDDRVSIGFWYQTARGPRRIPRDIEASEWSRIRGNYSERVTSALEPLLLLEDCDELIRAEAKSTAGQQLWRLLNLTDGLLGQGRNVLVAITTNEDLAALHPAVTRPGRSLAHLEVGRLNRLEATAWLAESDVRGAIGQGGATLAELFAIRAGTMPGSVSQAAPGTGLYL
jgi:hypothetical protein